MTAEPRRATILDVAARAGVSRQTVTRAINDMPGISAVTRQRVLEAARELNYRPSRFGRGLVEQGPITLGFAVKDLGNSFFAELGAAFVRAATPYGWSVVLAETAHAPQPEQAAAQLARRVDAIVGYDVLSGQIRGGMGLPVVRLDGSAQETEDSGVVELSAEKALADLAAHLGAAGVRRPVVVDLDDGDGGRSARTHALTAAMTPLRAGSEEPRVPIATARLRNGHETLVARILEDRPDAVIAFNDELAVRLLRALRLRGVDVPGDVRVVGIDGLEIASLVSPELTTLAIDLDQVARETVELVRGMLDGSVPLRGPQAHRVVHYRLERRASA